MPVRLRDTEIAEVIERMKVLRRRRVPLIDATHRVAEAMGIPQVSVYSVVRRMRSTQQVATEYIQSQSLKLAMRVVRKANVEQAIQVLSRPNIGVLDPQGDGGGGGGRQFVVGVAIDSLGSVKVGVQIGSSSQPGANSGKSLGAGGEEDGGQLQLEGAGEELGGDENQGDTYRDDGEDEEPEPLPVPVRRWYRPDPKPRTEGIEPAPIQEARHFGQSLATRLAIAQAERKEKAKDKRKDKERIEKRARELKEQLARARAQGQE